VFWLKMGLIVLLLSNGSLLLRAERHAGSDPVGAWKTLKMSSMISIALWMLVTLAGAALPNVS
jgi:hypothetical protein